MSKSRLILVVCVAAALAAGAGACKKKSRTMTPEVERLMRAQYAQRSPTPRPSPVGDMFDGALARRAFDAVREKAGVDLKVRELRLSALGLDVLTEDPQDANRLVLYRWKNEGGGLEGPQQPDPFGIIGRKSFDSALADWSLLPAMTAEAKTKSGFQNPEVALAIFSHPYSVFGGDEVVWSVGVTTREGGYKSEFFEFDAKGKHRPRGATRAPGAGGAKEGNGK